MASFGIRESKFRNAIVTVSKREKFYENIKDASLLEPTLGLTATATSFAYHSAQGGGSAIGVLPLTSTGKNHVPVVSAAYQQPLIPYGAMVTDISFNPFNPQQLFACSNDGSLKVFEIPADCLVADLTEPLGVYRTMVGSSSTDAWKGLAVHPLASGIVACRGPRSISLFDLSSPSLTGSSVVTTTGSTVFDGDLYSLSWSYDGNLLVATSKDKRIRILDPRQGQMVVANVPGHANVRYSTIQWLNNDFHFVSCGHGSAMEREMMLWDVRKLLPNDGAEDKCLSRDRIDSSIGPMMPLFDPDTGLLVLAGKGDTTIRLYEFVAGDIKPALHAINNTPVGGSDTIIGITLLPKQACDMMGCEVLRLLKLSSNDMVQPISCTIPRKEKLKFQGDLYPPSHWSAPPALTTESWWQGERHAVRQRVLIEDPGIKTSFSFLSKTTTIATTTTTTAVATSSVANMMNTASSSSSSAAAAVSVAVDTPTDSTIPSNNTDVKGHGSEADDTTTQDNKTKHLLNLGSSSQRFRHIHGTEPSKQGTYFNLRVSSTPSDSPIIACSDHYWAIPYQGSGGGPVYVSRHGEYGKVEPMCPVLNGHKDGSVIAMACKDRTLRFMDLRCGQIVGLTQTTTDVDGCTNSSASATSTTTSAASATTLQSIGRNLRVEWCSTSSGNSCLLTASSSSNGTRALHSWDPRSLHTPICTRTVDQGAGQLYPLFDDATGICCLVGKGDKIVRFYELQFLNEVSAGGSGKTSITVPSSSSSSSQSGATKEANNEGDDLMDHGGGATVDKCNEYASQGDSPFSGMCLLPSRSCDVHQVEVMRLLKLSSDSVTPMSFTVPRAEHLKSYFQDDLYRSIRSNQSYYTITDWTQNTTTTSSSSTTRSKAVTSHPSDSTQPLDICASLPYSFKPKFVSLKPSNMINLSERPIEEALLSAKNKNKNPTFRSEIEAKEMENQSRDNEFLRLQALAVQRSLYHPNKSSTTGGQSDGVMMGMGAVGMGGGIAAASTTTTVASSTIHRPLSRCVDATPVYDEPDSDDEDRWK